MSEWLSCAFTSALIGLVAGVVVALLHEWGHIAPLRRRCWQAELLLAKMRADPEGQAILAYYEAGRHDDHRNGH